MLRSLRHLPIKQKLVALTMAISGFALLLACAVFVLLDQAEFRVTMARDFAILADMFDDNVVAGIEFDDTAAIERTLQTIGAHPRILAACVYDKQGVVLAAYRRPGSAPGAALKFPPAQRTGQHFGPDRLDTFQDITLAGEIIGTVYIDSDLNEFRARAWHYVAITGVLLAGCLLVALVLASLLQRMISQPIEELAQTVAIVATQKDYTVRAHKQGNDELGRLVDGFNEMLGQIQGRDADLKHARDKLEERVAERTGELQRENGERKRVEEALRRQQTELRVLIDLVPALIVFKDLENIYRRVNERFAAAAHLSVAELEGKSSLEIFPAEAPRFNAEDAEVTRSGLPKLGLVELTHDPQGRELWVQTDKVPVTDPDGKVLGLVIMAQDITARIRTEESLRLLGSAVEQTKEAIMITEAELNLPGPKIIFVNSAFTRMTGYPAAEVLGRNPRLLQGPRTDRAVLDRLRRNLEQGEEFVGEAINYRKDGTEYVLEWQIAPLRNARGIVTHFVAIQRDVTERKEAEAALATAHRERVNLSRQAGMAEVATGVLHNVGNVLNSVNVSATLVTDQVRRTKAVNIAKVAALFAQHKADLAGFLTQDPRGQMIPDYLGTLAESLATEHQMMLEELEHLRKNIDHIKDIVSMQQAHARTSGVTEPVAVPDLVEDALRINAGSLTRHAVEIIRDYQARPVITTDKHKVMQILINLVGNARHACDETSRTDKKITVRTTGNEQGVTIAVSDNGIGIPAENLTRIFNHGFTTRKTGHGFGLHSGALAAKELGGSLSVQSDGPGHGATFMLELPLKAAAPSS